ncbi:Flagellar hook-associated protein 2 [Gammaproteobacteria bacterium]
MATTPTLSSPGIGSGLDIKAIVQQLMTVERIPLDSLQKKDQAIADDLSAYGRLSSSVSSFRDVASGLSYLSGFQVYKATSANTDLFSATADTTASAASVSVDVLQLAQKHKVGTDPSAQIASTHVFSDNDPDYTDGVLTLQVGTKSMAVDGDGKTLSQIRDAINTGTDNPGVTASLITDSLSGKQTLTLTAKDSGDANKMTVTDGLGLGLQDINKGYGVTLAAGDLDAKAKIDGVTVSSSTNTLKDALQGVTLTLKSADPGHPADLTVSQDRDTIKANIQKLASAFNSLRATIKDLQGNALTHDSTARLAEHRMMDVINSRGVSGNTFSNLSQVGLSLDKYGTMSLNTAQLDKALDADFEGVAKLFTDTGEGFAVKFRQAADQLTASSGPISARTEGLKSEQKSNQDREAQLQRRLDSTEQRYLKQYNSMDGLVAQLNQTGQALARQLGYG